MGPQRETPRTGLGWQIHKKPQAEAQPVGDRDTHSGRVKGAKEGGGGGGPREADRETHSESGSVTLIWPYKQHNKHTHHTIPKQAGLI